MIKGKKYFGLFVSDNEEFACDFETFYRGWELEKFNLLTEKERNEWLNELKKDSQNYKEIK